MTRDPLRSFSEDEKALYRARLRITLFRKLRAFFRRMKQERGWTQRDLAARLQVHPSVISRRLKGEENVTLDWVCDFARAMDARVEVSIVPLSAVRKPDVQMSVWTQTQAQPQASITQWMDVASPVAETSPAIKPTSARDESRLQ